MAIRRRWARKTVAAVSTGVAATIIGAWGTYLVGPRQEAAPLSVSAASVEPTHEPTIEVRLATSRISFADWQALVKQALTLEQRQAIFERYRGERVTWQGYVDQVNRVTPENGGTSASQFILVLYEDRETLASKSLGRAPALCLFPRDAADDLNALERGQQIVLEGTFAANTLHGQLLGTRLYKCEIIATD